MKKFYVVTLGCKVNQYESDGIGACLLEKGWTPGGKNDSVDLCIVNTCAVTAKAGMQSRQAIRKLIREHPNARIVVTGCHAQTDPHQISKIDRVDHIVSHRDKTRIADLADQELTQGFSFKPVDHTLANQFHSFSSAVQGSMTRAYLKIQDGCNAFCTYCIVPHARGGSVSMPESDVFNHLNQLSASGFKEVILTGIHTGLYGRDLAPKTRLYDLIRKIDEIRPVDRIRLSSIEPVEIEDRLIDLAGPDHILCDHFHIPLQSGDDRILKKMKRPYTAGFFKDMVLKIHEQIPSAGIGVDTLIGFPTETDREFQNTYDLIESLPVSYLHVFPFSPRRGTPAFHFEPKVDNPVLRERCRLMRELGQKKRKNFIQTNLGQPLKGLVQHQADPRTGDLKAVTSNYLVVNLPRTRGLRGTLVDLVPEQYDEDLNLFGKTGSIFLKRP